MDDLRARISRSLRRERESAGLSVSELARRAGVSKATVSQLESGTTGPSVETLWAIADALGLPFAAFVEERVAVPTLIRADAYAGIPAAAAPYVATLISACPPGARRDLYILQAEPGEPRRSLPHHVGTTEHVVLIAGRALVGPADAAEELRPGDYLSYPGDAGHVFEALEPRTSAVLISELR
jgi:transcriptional regulator with XRE-family HTH domain